MVLVLILIDDDTLICIAESYCVVNSKIRQPDRGPNSGANFVVAAPGGNVGGGAAGCVGASTV